MHAENTEQREKTEVPTEPNAAESGITSGTHAGTTDVKTNIEAIDDVIDEQSRPSTPRKHPKSSREDEMVTRVARTIDALRARLDSIEAQVMRPLSTLPD